MEISIYGTWHDKENGLKIKFNRYVVGAHRKWNSLKINFTSAAISWPTQVLGKKKKEGGDWAAYLGHCQYKVVDVDQREDNANWPKRRAEIEIC